MVGKALFGSFLSFFFTEKSLYRPISKLKFSSSGLIVLWSKNLCTISSRASTSSSRFFSSCEKLNSFLEISGVLIPTYSVPLLLSIFPKKKIFFWKIFSSWVWVSGLWGRWESRVKNNLSDSWSSPTHQHQHQPPLAELGQHYKLVNIFWTFSLFWVFLTAIT